MNNSKWAFLDDNGARHVIGLMHSPRSGHLVIYINKRVSVVDFSILKSKTYTLFINEEMIHIEISLENNAYSYSMKVDNEADTPKNRMRKERKKREITKIILIFIGLAIVLTTFLIWINGANQGKLENELEKWNGETIAKIYIDNPDSNHLIRYYFVRNGNIIEGQENLKQLNPDAAMGIPFENQDECIVIFHPKDPSVHKLDLSTGLESQILKWKTRLLTACENNRLGPSKKQCACVIEAANEFRGKEGLSTLYHQESLVGSNQKYNRSTFQQMVNAPEFLAIYRKICPEFNGN